MKKCSIIGSKQGLGKFALINLVVQNGKVDRITRILYPITGGDMSVIERIKGQIETNKVVLYMKGTPDFPQCGFSSQAVQVLDACGADYMHVNIFEDPELHEALKSYSNWPTYPQLYVNGELVGGCDIMIDLYKSGDLQTMLVAVVDKAE